MKLTEILTVEKIDFTFYDSTNTPEGAEVFVSLGEITSSDRVFGFWVELADDRSVAETIESARELIVQRYARKKN